MRTEGYTSHRYLTDDRDLRRRSELEVMHAPNGDYYIKVCPENENSFEGVRICTSGGASSRNPKLVKAVRDLFESLGGWGETIDDGR